MGDVSTGTIRRESDGTHDEELIGLLLVFFGHGVGSGLGGHADGTEDSDGGEHSKGDTPGDAGVGAGRVSGAGTMGTESDPVGCETV